MNLNIFILVLFLECILGASSCLALFFCYLKHYRKVMKAAASTGFSAIDVTYFRVFAMGLG